MNAQATDFQEFQRAFGRHLRDPRRNPRPAGVPARRMGVYNELLFNNICGFLDACFPICRALLGDQRWRRLNRSFYRDWPLHTPWFREIPREFVRYLAEAVIAQPRPAWLAELAHYEWVELALDVIDAPTPPHDPAGDLLGSRIVLNPACMVLAYAWPVHRIGPGYRPRKPAATHLVVFRDAQDQVRFVEINPATARLLALLGEADGPGASALGRIAAELQHPAPDQLLAFGTQLLADLRAQGIVLGTASA
jgi:hypothetical protein